MEVGEKACFVVRKIRKCFLPIVCYRLAKENYSLAAPFLATYHNPYAPASSKYNTCYFCLDLTCLYLACVCNTHKEHNEVFVRRGVVAIINNVLTS
jgi:hypothetical protein